MMFTAESVAKEGQKFKDIFYEALMMPKFKINFVINNWLKNTNANSFIRHQLEVDIAGKLNKQFVLFLITYLSLVHIQYYDVHHHYDSIWYNRVCILSGKEFWEFSLIH